MLVIGNVKPGKPRIRIVGYHDEGPLVTKDLALEKHYPLRLKNARYDEVAMCFEGYEGTYLKYRDKGLVATQRQRIISKKRSEAEHCVRG
jgi:hypothetical protein